MSAQNISPVFESFKDIDGQPLENGYIYIGTAGLEASTNQITVYWDSALTDPASQPIRTIAGYPVNNGAKSSIYVSVDDYSITVNNKKNSPVSSSLNQTGRYSGSILTYKHTGASGVNRTIQSKLEDSVSVKDFGAVGDGVSDDTAAFNAALSASNSIYVPIGDYLVGEIPLSSNMQIRGESQISTRLLANGNDVDIFTIASQATYLILENFSGLANGFSGVDFFHQQDQSLYIARCSFMNLNLHADLEYCFNGAFIYATWREIIFGLTGTPSTTHVAILCADDSASPSPGHTMNLNQVENCTFTNGRSSSGESMVNVVNGDIFTFEDCSFESSVTAAFDCEAVRGVKFLSCWFESIDATSIINMASGGIGAHGSKVSMDGCHTTLNTGPTVSVVAGDAACSISVNNCLFVGGVADLVFVSGGASLSALSSTDFDNPPATLNPDTTDNTSGTWTPEFVNMGTGTYGSQVGEWSKVGDVIVAVATCSMATLGTASGAIQISGLPFTSKSGTGINAVGSVAMQNMSVARADSICFLPQNSSVLRIYTASGVAGTISSSTVTHADLGATGEIFVSFTYIVD